MALVRLVSIRETSNSAEGDNDLEQNADILLKRTGFREEDKFFGGHGMPLAFSIRAPRSFGTATPNDQ
jgi:hypothetical protein